MTIFSSSSLSSSCLVVAAQRPDLQFEQSLFVVVISVGFEGQMNLISSNLLI